MIRIYQNPLGQLHFFLEPPRTDLHAGCVNTINKTENSSTTGIIFFITGKFMIYA
jgi:hypothetical protein